MYGDEASQSFRGVSTHQQRWAVAMPPVGSPNQILKILLGSADVCESWTQMPRAQTAVALGWPLQTWAWNT